MDAAGNLSPYSNFVTATTLDTAAPSAPTGLTGTGLSSSQINLGWTAAIDNVAVTQYLVERCVASACAYTQIGTSAGPGFSDVGLTANTAYSYRVRAADALGNLGAYSNVASLSTLPSTTTS